MRSYYDKNQPKDRWIRLPESIREMKVFSQISNNATEQKVELAVVGVKSDLKFEKRLQKNFELHKAVELIQRAWRGYRGRKQHRHLLETRASVVI